MRKKIAGVWVIVSVVAALVLALGNIGPAAVINEFVGFDSFFAAFALLFLALILPMFIVFVILNYANNKKNQMPSDLTGKTGIIIKREKELSGGALLYDVKINGATHSKLGMGKKIFIELPAGEYTIQTWMGKAHSPQLTCTLDAGKVLAYSTKVDFNKSVMAIALKGEMLVLIPYPVSAL